MRLFMRQKVFSWTDRFCVYDEQGDVAYTVEGEAFSFGRKLHLLDRQGWERAFVQQKVFSLYPRYFIYRDGQQVAEAVQKFSLFHPSYFVDGLGWNIRGDLFAHEFEIDNGATPIVRVYKDWLSWGDAYAIDIDPYVDEALALAVVLAIDAMIENRD